LLIDGRFYIRPEEITIWEMIPIARSGRGDGDYVVNPYIQFVYRGIHFAFQSKHMMWMLLDAAWPNEPLPRTPINNDLFYRTDVGDPVHEILNDLVNEGDGNYIEVVIGDRMEEREHHPFEVKAIMPNFIGSPDTTLRGVADVAGRDEWNCITGILPYRDSHHTHERDALIFDHHPLRVICYDLGRRICVMGYFMVFDEKGNDIDYRPKQAVVIKKSEDFFFDIAKNTIHSFFDTLGQGYEHYKSIETPPPVSIKSSLMRNYESDIIGHERWLMLN